MFLKVKIQYWHEFLHQYIPHVNISNNCHIAYTQTWLPSKWSTSGIDHTKKTTEYILGKICSMVKGEKSINFALRLALISWHLAVWQFGWFFFLVLFSIHHIHRWHNALKSCDIFLQSLLDSHCYFWCDFFDDLMTYLFIVGSWHDISLWRWRLYGRGHRSHGSLPTQAGTLIDAGKTAMQKNEK